VFPGIVKEYLLFLYNKGSLGEEIYNIAGENCNQCPKLKTKRDEIK
jgi:hypothetical protein